MVKNYIIVILKVENFERVFFFFNNVWKNLIK